ASAPGLPEIHEAALDCLSGTLGMDLVALLRPDDAGALRTVAGRGLSDESRRAIDALAPCLSDQPEALSSDHSGAVRLPERQLTLVPIRFGGRLLGAFAIDLTRRGEVSPGDLAMAQAIAGHV